jgi:hypothetical protein
LLLLKSFEPLKINRRNTEPRIIVETNNKKCEYVETRGAGMPVKASVDIPIQKHHHIIIKRKKIPDFL